MTAIRIDKNGVSLTLHADGLALDKRRLSELLFGAGNSASDTLDQFIADPTFPKPCKLLKNERGKVTKRFWFYADVVQWFIVHKEADSRAEEFAAAIAQNLG